MIDHETCVTTGPQEPAHVTDHTRRATLARLAGLCGLALSGEALAALAAPNQPSTSAAPEILTGDELALTGVLAELIIPKTDTPGALAVGAHRTIDHLLAVCALGPAQQSFKAGLARLDASAITHAGNRFAALPAARQTALLKAIDSASAPFTSQDQQFFRTLKQYTVFAYYTSEPGATRELAYVPIPGRFKGTVKVTRATRTWAL